MLPGRTYKPEDILQILRRRIWWLLVPFAIVSVVVVLVANRMPNLYRSQAVIAIQPQTIPEAYVRPTVSEKIEDRLPAIREAILTHSRLERVIVDFNLYPGLRARGLLQDAVDRMVTTDIETKIIGNDAFTVAFTSTDPRIARDVANRLSRMFLDESRQSRKSQADLTDAFLENTLEQTRQRLLDHERKVEAFRRQHAGELPEQLGSNMQAAQNVQMQVQSLVESINRDVDRKLLLERQLGELANTPVAADAPSMAAATPMGPDAAGGGSTEQQLTSARAALTVLRARYSEAHPDVQRTRRIVSDLEKKLEAELLQRPTSDGIAVGVSPTELARRKRETDLRSDLDLLTKQIADKRASEARLRELSTLYQRRADAAPTRQTEMIELTRDYDMLQKLYASQLAKREDSKIAADLASREISEQLTMIEEARLPERPFSPNRRRVHTMSMVGGLAFAVLLVVLLEYRDRSLRTDEEVSSVIGLPVLAIVPSMQPEWARRRNRRTRLLLNATLGTTVLTCLTVLAYVITR